MMGTTLDEEVQTGFNIWVVLQATEDEEGMELTPLL